MILLNRTIDVLIYMAMAVYIIHEISIDSTTSHFIVQSLLSAGGIGALIFSLASKDLAVEIVGGMTLGMYDIFHVGDRVRINESNLSGKVIEIGFVETIIQR
jgi:small-conductance mechanosensitive channel